ncbi:LANO_0E12112g1_1 [Lachancea nothofagi CBS 11611]|uniref:LANO_0E12112g1_1 n=1 Tax=Lachancea nothofagi CBS 11611 TaxID=1266666 RepID=A0A1G4JXY1_9SACH|nr:LANO_0E12112g1_1 [Lachancea nothofagi CBS 11611]
MDLLDNAYHNVYDSIASLDFQHVVRLVIVIGGYALMRNLAQRHLAKKHLERKVREGQADKAEQRQKDLVADPEGAESASDNAFGWGNKTRKRVKTQHKLLEEKIDELKKNQGSLDDDKDIEDLLED